MQHKKTKAAKSSEELVKGVRDNLGNLLLKWSDGSVTLKLITEKGRQRNLGVIIGDSFHAKRKFSHLHIKTKSYGFNYYLMKNSLFTWVMLHLEDGTSYKIPKSTILSFGKVLYFKNSQEGDSFELQLFLPFDIIKGYKCSDNNE
jgi:hypothetical protein